MQLWLVKHFICHASAILANAVQPFLTFTAYVAVWNPLHLSYFSFVPHTTHKAQPLDTAVYGPLKSNCQSVSDVSPWHSYN